MPFLVFTWILNLVTAAVSLYLSWWIIAGVFLVIMTIVFLVMFNNTENGTKHFRTGDKVHVSEKIFSAVCFLA